MLGVACHNTYFIRRWRYTEVNIDCASSFLSESHHQNYIFLSFNLSFYEGVEFDVLLAYAADIF